MLEIQDQAGQVDLLEMPELHHTHMNGVAQAQEMLVQLVHQEPVAHQELLP